MTHYPARHDSDEGNNFRLSKSSFLLGRQCPLRLWLQSRKIGELPVDGEDYHEAADDFSEQADAVERLAEKLFPGGIEVVPNNSDEFAWSAANAERTAALMADAGTTALFQAVLASDRMVGIADILERASDGWILYEVKASSQIKNIFYWDLAFQWRLLESCQHPVVAAKVIYLNRAYVFPGGEHDPAKLLIVEDCTKRIRSILSQTQEEIAAQFEMLDQANAPTEQPGRRCRVDRDSKDGNRPSDCGHLELAGYCGKHLPKHWSLRLHRISQPQIDIVTREQLQRIENLLPDQESFNWTAVQARIIRATRSGHPEIERDGLQEQLGRLQWPLTFMDFEYEPAVAVPPFPGMRPNQRLPFQWSMQIQPARGARLVPVQPFLHDTVDDPREFFIESLLASLPSDGSVVVHYKSAEGGLLELFREWFPGRYDQVISAIQARFFDTCQLARETYYHPAMQCSFSIKKLAPAVLGRGYDDLAVQDGMAAVRHWRSLLQMSSESEPWNEVRQALLEYCDRDTELMSGLLDEFQRLAQLEPR